MHTHTHTRTHAHTHTHTHARTHTHTHLLIVCSIFSEPNKNEFSKSTGIVVGKSKCIPKCLVEETAWKLRGEGEGEGDGDGEGEEEGRECIREPIIMHNTERSTINEEKKQTTLYVP